MATEKRLIDANVWRHETCLWCNEQFPDEPCEPSECPAMQYIDNFPTVNAVEVVHGRWVVGGACNHVPHRIKNPEKWVTYKCSVCGYSNGRKQSNYCPNCGAKMDGDGNA